MIDAADLERSLSTMLPTVSPALVSSFARVLAAAANGALPGAALQQRLAAPEFEPLLRRLAGRRIQSGGVALSFEQQQLSERAVGTRQDDSVRLKVIQAGEIDQRQGVAISGGTVNGVVVGFNEGTINYTEVKVNIQAGTLLDPAARPNIVRCAPPQPPLPVRNFYDRTQPLHDLQVEIQPRHGAWLTGRLGCGLTALLRQAANTPAAQSLSDGVLYVDGAVEPADADDLVQELYNYFYKGERGEVIRLNPGAARSELANLRALFVLDRPRLSGDALAALADTLAGRGAVLVSADSPAPDTLLDLQLDGLPRQDAIRLIATGARVDAADAETAALLGRLCAVLADLPLPLLLAARLIRMRVAPLERLVAVAEELAGEREPLARAAQLVLTALADAERAVLAALVRVTAHDIDLEALAAASGQPPEDVEDALGRMIALRLVRVGNGRYALVSASLRRVLARLLPRGDERRNAAAFFAGAAALRLGDMAWLGREWGNLILAARESLLAGNTAQAGALVRAVQPHLVLNGLWSSWSKVIDLAEQAAQAGGDLALRAWALHERGTRAGLLGDRAAASAHLAEARRLRLDLNDQAGAAATAHNMEVLKLLPPPPAPPAPPGGAMLSTLWIVSGTLLALLVLGGGGAALAKRFIVPPPIPPPSLVAAPTASATPPDTPIPTSSPTPPATDTPTPPTTDTPTPPTTDTPTPPTTDTPEPPATDTPVPPATDTPEPPATDTPEPPATDTPVPPTSVPRAPGPVMAFYYPWYELSDWSSGKMSDLAAPTYSGGDDDAMRRHIQQADDAGIDALACAWYGPHEDRIDPRCRRLLQLAQESGRAIRVALYPDPSSFVSSLYTPDGMVEALGVLRRDLMSSPAYFTYQGKPVVFFFRPEQLGGVAAWQQLRERADPNHEEFWFGGSDDFSYLDAFDALYFFDITWEDTDGAAMASYARHLDEYNQRGGTRKPFIATVMPGYDDLKYRGGHRKDRANGEYYRGTWQQAIDYNAAAVVLTSFNEFYEGSYIEPSQLYGGQYLQLTREGINRYRAASP